MNDREIIEALQSMPANQTIIAGLLGVSQPVISKMLERGVINKGGTYGEWVPALIAHYQTGAAGRGGQDLQKELTQAKIDSERESALEKRMNRMTKQGDIILKSELLPTLITFAANVQFQVESIGEKVIQAIESKFDIDLDDEIVNGNIRTALGSIAKSAEELVGNMDGSSGLDEASKKNTNG